MDVHLWKKSIYSDHVTEAVVQPASKNLELSLLKLDPVLVSNSDYLLLYFAMNATLVEPIKQNEMAVPFGLIDSAVTCKDF